MCKDFVCITEFFKGFPAPQKTSIGADISKPFLFHSKAPHCSQDLPSPMGCSIIIIGIDSYYAGHLNFTNWFGVYGGLASLLVNIHSTSITRRK